MSQPYAPASSHWLQKTNSWDGLIRPEVYRVEHSSAQSEQSVYSSLIVRASISVLHHALPLLACLMYISSLHNGSAFQICERILHTVGIACAGQALHAEVLHLSPSTKPSVPMSYIWCTSHPLVSSCALELCRVPLDCDRFCNRVNAKLVLLKHFYRVYNRIWKLLFLRQCILHHGQCLSCFTIQGRAVGWHTSSPCLSVIDMNWPIVPFCLPLSEECTYKRNLQPS